MKTNRIHLWKVLVAVPLLLAVIGCASGDIDDPDSPPNILRVTVTESPAVTGTRDQTTGSCLFTITEWQARLTNEPKNPLAVTPGLSDIITERLDVTYEWPGAAVVVPPPRELPMPGTIAAEEEQSIRFEPILLQDFDPAMEGTTGILNMVLRARHADGTRIDVPFQESLVVASCQ